MHGNPGIEGAGKKYGARNLTFKATFSAWVAGWDSQDSAEQLIQVTDTALHQAKERGRNRIAAAS